MRAAADRVRADDGTALLERQRRALRALYATCAVPGCAVRFDDCHVHHVIW